MPSSASAHRRPHLAMLVNEAVDAVRLRVAAPHDIELAMTKGVNYPRGLLAWGDEIGRRDDPRTRSRRCKPSTARIAIGRARFGAVRRARLLRDVAAHC